MQVKRWTYQSKGRVNHIELFHFLSGNVVIKLNQTILFEDNITGSKQRVFKFYIDDELLEIKIVFVRKQYVYVLRKLDRQFFKTGLLKSMYKKKFFGTVNGLAIILFSLFVLAVISKIFYGYYQIYTDLKRNGIKGVAKISNISNFYLTYDDNVKYTYIVNNSILNGFANAYVNDEGLVIAKNGMPLQLGDEFEVIYSSKNTGNSKILFNKPTQAQLQYYKELLKKRNFMNLRIDSESNAFNNFYECLLDYVINNHGIDGLANIYFKDKNFWENFSNNKWFYRRMIKTKKYKENEIYCFKLYLQNE